MSPVYDASGFGPTPKLLIPGEPGYFFGSLNYNQAPTKFSVTNVALTSNVATVTIAIRAGNVPAVGNLVSIRKTTSTSGLFNVTNAVITGVTYPAANASGTITFALTHADVVSGADTGEGLVPVPEVSEALTANGASWPLSVARVFDEDQLDATFNRTFQVICSFPTPPTAATVKLQGAINNVDAEYVDMATVAVVAGSSVTQTAGGIPQQNFRFIRLNVSGISGTGTVIAKVL